MKKTIIALVAFTVGIAAAFALQTTATSRRIQQFENEHAKVWKSIILPGQPLRMHRHDHPRAIIALKGGTLSVMSESGEKTAMHWETGKAYWLSADLPDERHGDVNEGTEPIEVMVVELK